MPYPTLADVPATIDERFYKRTLTGEEFNAIARDAAAKRQGGSPEEAGPITAFTSDEEIAKRAGKIGHTLAVPTSLIVALLNLERRVSQLEQKKNPACHPRMETR